MDTEENIKYSSSLKNVYCDYVVGLHVFNGLFVVSLCLK